MNEKILRKYRLENFNEMLYDEGESREKQKERSRNLIQKESI